MRAVEPKRSPARTARSRNSASTGGRMMRGSRHSPMRAVTSRRCASELGGKNCSRCRAGVVEQPGHPAYPAARRTVIDAPAHHEIERRILLRSWPRGVEVIRRPDVVVADIGDPGSACRSDTFVVREALAPGIVRQVAPDDPLLREGPNRRLGFVAAPVSDHDQLEIGAGLAEQRHDGRTDVSSAPVGGENDREERNFTHRN